MSTFFHISIVLVVGCFFLQVSKRRYRRWLNDRLLRELAPPLEASEIASLFAPPPWGNN